MNEQEKDSGINKLTVRRTGSKSVEAWGMGLNLLFIPGMSFKHLLGILALGVICLLALFISYSLGGGWFIALIIVSPLIGGLFISLGGLIYSYFIYGRETVTIHLKERSRKRDETRYGLIKSSNSIPNHFKVVPFDQSAKKCRITITQPVVLELPTSETITLRKNAITNSHARPIFIVSYNPDNKTYFDNSESTSTPDYEETGR